MQQIIALPIIFIGIYLIITLLVAVFPFRRYTYQSVEDFHLASGNMGFFIISIGTIVSYYSGSTWTGWQEFICNNGPLGAYIFPFIASSGILFYFLAERIQPIAKEKGFLTIGDYLENNYNSRKLRIIGGGLSFFVAVLWIVMDLITMGYTLAAVTQNKISIMQGEFVALLIILVYVLWGGIESIVWTDLFQGIIMLVGGMILCIFILNYYFGDAFHMTQALSDSGYLKVYSIRDSGIQTQWLSLIIVSSLASVCFPATFVKMYMGKNINVLRKSGILLSLTAIWSLVYFIPGMAASAMNFQANGSPDSFLVLIANSGQLLMFCFAGVFILAVCIGSIDILLFTAAMCLMKDIGINIGGFRKIMPDGRIRTPLAVLRLIIAFTALLVFVLSAVNQYALIDIALMSTQAIAQLFPAIAGAAYWNKTSEKGAFLGLAVGLLILTVMWLLHTEPFGFVPGFWALLANVTILAGCSLFMRKKGHTDVNDCSHIL